MSDQTASDATTSPGDLESDLGAIFDDPEFHIIERWMSRLNLFEAVGATRSEQRHSNFLAYVLSPNRPHGLHTRPLAAVLRAILTSLPRTKRPIMTLELIAGELDDAIIYRERDNIDILIELPNLKLVVAIENKVDAGEADGQLERYAERLKSAFPDYRRLLVFLTPAGSQPSHGLYVSYSYTELAEVLESLTTDTFEPVPEDTKLIIRHYVDMVRRHIVENEQLGTLALRLYERHKEAFEFIFKYRPEPESLLTIVRQRALNAQGLIEDRSGSNLFRFVPEIWDQRLKVIKGDPAQWTKTGRGILFEAKTYPDKPGRVNISLVLGPGNADTRSRVYKAAAGQPKIFSGLVKGMGAKWVTIFSRDLLTSVQAKDLTFEAQSLNVGLGWSDFQAQSLMALISAVLAIDKQLADSAESG
jgi:hypothetical protein